ncbi:MAG: CAP domain-containing protein, partial [Pseudomonadota bacterium]
LRIDAMIRLVVILWALLAGGGHADPSVLAPLNAYRADSGRAPLSYSKRLQRIAQLHADDLRRSGRFSHRGSDGSDLGDRMRRAGYGYCFAAENIAKGQRDRIAVLRSWAGSRSHRRNMLSRNAAEVGLARADGNLWVMVLGRAGC